MIQNYLALPDLRPSKKVEGDDLRLRLERIRLLLFNVVDNRRSIFHSDEIAQSFSLSCDCFAKGVKALPQIQVEWNFHADIRPGL